MSEFNSHIFVQEDGLWAIRGRWTTAITDNDPIDWETSSNGKLCLSLLCVSSYMFIYIYLFVEFLNYVGNWLNSQCAWIIGRRLFPCVSSFCIGDHAYKIYLNVSI